MRPLTINVDMDGVVYDFTEAFARLSPGLELDLNQWDLGLDSQTFRTRFEEAIINGVFIVGRPILGAIGGLHDLINAGHQVRLVTAKQMGSSFLTYVAQEGTLKWLQSFGLLDRVEVVFTNHAKVGYPADVVIDDHPGSAWAQRYADNLLFDQPWNQNIDKPTHLHIHRMVGWESVMEWMNGEKAA